LSRLESALESWAVQWARTKAVPTAKLTNCTGIPDRIFFVPGGKPLLVEFKRNKKSRYQPLQEPYLEKLIADGYSAHSVADKEEFLALFNTLLKHARPVPWSAITSFKRGG
jgi:hypothetical protein